MRSVAGGIDGLEAVFDDGSLVADGGLLLAGTVMSRLGLEALIDETVRPGGSAGSGAGRKVLSLVASIQEVPPLMARMTVTSNSILPRQEAFLVDAPTPTTSPHRWIQA